MLAEYPELLIRPLKTNVGYERWSRPIQLAPQTTETYLGFSKFGRSIGGDFSTRDFAGDEPALFRPAEGFPQGILSPFRVDLPGTHALQVTGANAAWGRTIHAHSRNG
jgi:hypothetical protein